MFQRFAGRLAALVVATVLALGLLGLFAAPQAQAEGQAGSQGVVAAYFLNVGQGDSEFLVLNDGTTILIDAGESWAGDIVVSYVRDVLGYDHIDWLVATHPHADHIGGLTSVLYSDIRVGNILAPDVAGESSSFWNFIEAAQNIGVPMYAAEAGQILHDAAGCRVEVLSPAAGANHADLNDWSIILKVTYGNVSMLFTGDATYKVLDTLGVGHVDVLKVAHHGSNTSTSIPLLMELSPSVAVIEVGWGNDYGLPSVESIDELWYCDVVTWRTDVDGTVVVTTDGTSIGVVSETGATTPVPREEVEARLASERAEAAAIAAAQAGVADPGDIVVCRSKSGQCYHYPSCSTLKSTPIECTVAQALEQGLRPCSVCNPPSY